MRKLVFAAAAGTILFLSGCSLKQEYTLEEDLSGEMTFDLTMADIFVSSMEELMLFSAPEQDSDSPPEFLSLEMFREEWKKVQGSTLVTLNKPDRRNLEGKIRFSNILEMFSPESGFTGSPALQISRGEEGKPSRIVFHLNRQNYQDIARRTPLLNTPAVKSFGPLENRESSREEYREMVATFLGAQGPPALDESRITIIIRTKGRILSQSGGRLTDPHTFRYEAPLIDYLLLKEPIRFALTIEN